MKKKIVFENTVWVVFFLIFLFKINFYIFVLNYFDVLMLKIIFKK
jgi:hypothetical protein